MLPENQEISVNDICQEFGLTIYRSLSFASDLVPLIGLVAYPGSDVSFRLFKGKSRAANLTATMFQLIMSISKIQLHAKSLGMSLSNGDYVTTQWTNFESSGSPAFVATGGNQNGTYVSFDNSSGASSKHFYAVNTNLDLNVNTHGGFTFFALVSLSATDVDNARLWTGNDAYGNFIEIIQKGSKWQFVMNGGSYANIMTPDNTVTANEWHVVACRYQTTGKAQIFKNGTSVASATTTNAAMSNRTFTTLNYIGKSLNNDPYMNMKLSHLSVFDRPLNDYEVSGVSAYLMSTAYVTGELSTAVHAYPPADLSSATTTISGQVYGNGIYAVTSSSVFSGGYENWKMFAASGWWACQAYSYHATTGAYLRSVSTVVENVGTVYGEWNQVELPVALSVTSYSMTKTQFNYPKSWCLVGSSDQSTWYLIDSRENQTSAQWSSGSRTFTVTPSDHLTFLRWIVKENSPLDWAGLNYMIFYGTESNNGGNNSGGSNYATTSITLKHPNGTALTYDAPNRLVKVGGNYAAFTLDVVANEFVYNYNKNRVALKKTGTDLYFRHAGNTLKFDSFIASNYDFSWHIVYNNSGGYKIFNDYSSPAVKYYLGYDGTNVVIAPEGDSNAIFDWVFDPPIHPSYVSSYVIY